MFFPLLVHFDLLLTFAFFSFSRRPETTDLMVRYLKTVTHLFTVVHIFKDRKTDSHLYYCSVNVHVGGYDIM